MTLTLLDKPFLSNTDIMKIMRCSRAKAQRIKSIIKAKLVEQGKELYTNDVPTKLFIELVNLDANSINAVSTPPQVDLEQQSASPIETAQTV